MSDQIEARHAPVRSTLLPPLAQTGVGLTPSGAKTSTESVTVRPSLACKAPTPTTLRSTSSPRSLRIEMTTEYSHRRRLRDGGKAFDPQRQRTSPARDALRSPLDRTAGDGYRPDKRSHFPGWWPCSAGRCASCRWSPCGRECSRRRLMANTSSSRPSHPSRTRLDRACATPPRQ